jgi:hypothetical protein
MRGFDKEGKIRMKVELFMQVIDDENAGDGRPGILQRHHRKNVLLHQSQTGLGGT